MATLDEIGARTVTWD